MKTIEANFYLTSTRFDHGIASGDAEHTIETRAALYVSAEPPQVDGQLRVIGIDLKPGQKITAVFTITDEESSER